MPRQRTNMHQALRAVGQQKVISALRKVIRETVPEAEERLYTGWGGIGYQHPVAGYFCGIFPMTGVVKLAFEYGAFMTDPDRVLKSGTTSVKQVRYMEFRSVKEVKKPVVKKYRRLALRSARNRRRL